MKHINIKLVFTYLLFSGTIGQIMADLYLPSLPAIQVSLNTSTHMIQLSVAFFMYGYSVSQLVYGPTSDAFGRKSPLIVGFSIAILGTLLAMLSTSPIQFLLGRLFQGLGCGAGWTISRATLRDIFHDNQLLAKFSSYLSAFSVTFITAAPLIGSYIQFYAGWHFTFLALLVYAAILLLILVLVIPETNVHRHKDLVKLKSNKKSLISLFSNKNFAGYMFTVALACGGIISWLTTGPFLIQTVLGLSPIAFGRIAFCGGIAFVIGSILNSRLINHFKIVTLVQTGFILMLIAGTVLFASSFFGISTIILVVPVYLFLFSGGLIFPNAYTAAMKPFRETAGLASAFIGFSQIMGGALFSSIMSYVHENNQIPLSLAFLAIAVLGTLISFFILKDNSVPLKD